jgi:hypothetical protein
MRLETAATGERLLLFLLIFFESGLLFAGYRTGFLFVRSIRLDLLLILFPLL